MKNLTIKVEKFLNERNSKTIKRRNKVSKLTSIYYMY